MKYNWTDIIDRSGTNAIATEINPILDQEVNENFSKIPMWIADMNFKTVPTVAEEMIKRANHPLYGYFIVPDEYYDSIINWQKNRNGVENLSKENIGYENSVLGGLSSCMNILCSKGDNILLHSPTYVGFTHCLENNGYNLIHSPLYIDEDGIWRMDYEDMENKIKEYNIHTAVFCSPHNPTGRVWEREELEKAYAIFKKYDVYVVSDEIWSDITLYDNKHIPSQLVNEDAKNRTIAMYAPSKTFNLAGLVGSYHIVYNNYFNDRLRKESSLSHYNNPNLMSVSALIGAYKKEGYEWVDELRQVIAENIDYGYNFILENFKNVHVQKPQGTYLLYLDLKDYCIENDKTLDEILKKGQEYGVLWQDGRPFNNDYTIRMNLALPKSLVMEAFDRLKKYVFK